MIVEPAAADHAPDRLFGRKRGHALRVRQQRLLDVTLPRLRYDLAAPCLAPSCMAESWPGPDRALWLEIGFGGGEHAQALITAEPEIGLIACEVFANGICSLLARLVPLGAEATGALPDNLRLWDGDARLVLRALPPGRLTRLFLMFPDPWPKTRHAGRRFVGPATIALAARVLAPGSEWRIASDDPTYQAWVEGCFAGFGHLFACDASGYERPMGWPATRYEAKALGAGRRPRYWTMRRLEAAS